MAGMPNGAAGLDAGAWIAEWVATNNLSGLAGRTQADIQAFYGAIVQGSQPWIDATQQFFQVILGGFQDLSTFLSLLVQAITGVPGALPGLTSFMAARWNQLADALLNIGDIFGAFGGSLIKLQNFVTNILALFGLNITDANITPTSFSVQNVLTNMINTIVIPLGLLADAAGLTEVSTAIHQIGDILTGAVITPINSGVALVKTWYTSYGYALPNAIINAGNAVNDILAIVNNAGTGLTAATLGTLIATLNTLVSGIVAAFGGSLTTLQNVVLNILKLFGIGSVGTGVAGTISGATGSFNVTTALTSFVNTLLMPLNLLASQAALNQIGDILSGLVVTPVNTAVQQFQTWYAGNAAYLQNIPNTAVQGISSWGATMGASLQALGNSIWSAVFGGTPPGGNTNPTAVGQAVQQVVVDLNSADDIAKRSRDILQLRAITKQTYLAIDPSADPVFSLDTINGVSPSTVSLTSTKSVMGLALLPDLAKKKSIAWMGGPLTNVKEMYLNLYSVNKTTGAFEKFYTSTDLIAAGTLSNPASGLAWSFHNLPIANWFDVTIDGTGGQTSIVKSIGDYVVCELQMRGTGAYTMLGINKPVPTLDTNIPKAPGAARTTLAPPAYLAAGSVGKGGGSVTSTINVPADADCIVVPVSISIGGGGGGIAANINGTTIPVVDTYTFTSGNAIAYCVLTGLPSSLTGSGKTVTVTCSGYYIAARAFAYKGVSSVGSTSKVSGASGTIISQSISNTANQTILQLAANVSTTAAFTGYNKTTRWNELGTYAVNINTFMGEFVGSAASQTGSMFTSTSAAWGSMMLPLNGIVEPAPASIAIPTYDAATPWFSTVGAAGRSVHSPESWEKEAAGTYTYTMPDWVEDGDFIDVVPCGAGAGGSFVGSTVTGSYDIAHYKGGGAGAWNAKRFVVGDGHDIPTGVRTLTVVVGAGGAGGAHNHPAHTPSNGVVGGNTVVSGTGVLTRTATGGAANGNPNTTGLIYDLFGMGPGNTDHEGVTYFGGTGDSGVYPGIAGAGAPPGSGGAAKWNGANGAHTVDENGHSGADGACYITAIQNY